MLPHMPRLPRVVRVTLRADGPFPPHYLIDFTCGHPELVRADSREASLAMFGRVLQCLSCERSRDV